MMAKAMDSVLAKGKFRGSMLGSLIGDCMGAPYEGEEFSQGLKTMVRKYFDKLDGPYFVAPFKSYTDDTAMTKSVAKCLIEKPPLDVKYLAKLFVQEYFLEPRRGYGAGVVEVFKKLRKNKFEDLERPAAEQFNGSGSYGNGGAMRVAPIGLFFNGNYEGMIDAAERCTKITHTNSLGVNGALLQCIAVHQSFQLDPKDKLDVTKFADDLITKMEIIEQDQSGIVDPNEPTPPYKEQLMKVKELLSCDDPNDPIVEEEVIGSLGNSIAALNSVPTAIYCFLRAHSEIPGIETDNVFRRSIQYAVSLAGDCDTIASMTGAISGAYFGDSCVGENMKKHCEFHEEIVHLADKLYEASLIK